MRLYGAFYGFSSVCTLVYVAGPARCLRRSKHVDGLAQGGREGELIFLPLVVFFRHGFDQ